MAAEAIIDIATNADRPVIPALNDLTASQPPPAAINGDQGPEHVASAPRRKSDHKPEP
jgi:hypothetical protein